MCNAAGYECFNTLGGSKFLYALKRERLLIKKAKCSILMDTQIFC